MQGRDSTNPLGAYPLAFQLANCVASERSKSNFNMGTERAEILLLCDTIYLVSRKESVYCTSVWSFISDFRTLTKLEFGLK